MKPPALFTPLLVTARKVLRPSEIFEGDTEVLLQNHSEPDPNSRKDRGFNCKRFHCLV